MNHKRLVIVFVKNPETGRVKTRLAQTIGETNALLIYKELLIITRKAIENLTGCSIHVYFSEKIPLKSWMDYPGFVQKGSNLGEKMLNAFQDGFEKGFNSIILIGSDLPGISAPLIQKGFEELEQNDIVLGPSEDGGYYLIGMKKLHEKAFIDKPWSSTQLLEKTLQELNHLKTSLLPVMNDVDDYEDLIKHPNLLKKIKHKYKEKT